MKNSAKNNANSAEVPDRPIAAVIGNSHVNALIFASDSYAQRTVPPPSLGFRFLGLQKPEYSPMLVHDQTSRNTVLNPVIIAALNETLAGAEWVVSSLRGNAHDVLGLVNHPVPFDFVLQGHEHLPLEPDAQIIPASLMTEILTAKMNKFMHGMKHLRSLSNLPCFHINPPPPIPSAEHIFACRSSSFHPLLEVHGLTPKLVRFKLWKLQAIISEQLCRSLGFHFVDVPPEAIDEQGFLIPEAWANNPNHGNAWYGGRVLLQLEKLLSGTLSVEAADGK